MVVAVLEAVVEQVPVAPAVMVVAVPEAEVLEAEAQVTVEVVLVQELPNREMELVVETRDLTVPLVVLAVDSAVRMEDQEIKVVVAVD